jgi:hypothetical protein
MAMMNPGQALNHKKCHGYSARHNPFAEWAHNAADIDSSKIAWAREIDSANNQEIVDYYKDRKA